MKTTEDAEDAEGLQKRIQDFASSVPLCLGGGCCLRWRASSYITMPPATETFNDVTRPSIGIETTKSHLRRTRSCNPFPRSEERRVGKECRARGGREH